MTACSYGKNAPRTTEPRTASRPSSGVVHALRDAPASRVLAPAASWAPRSFAMLACADCRLNRRVLSVSRLAAVRWPNSSRSPTWTWFGPTHRRASLASLARDANVIFPAPKFGTGAASTTVSQHGGAALVSTGSGVPSSSRCRQGRVQTDDASRYGGSSGDTPGPIASTPVGVLAGTVLDMSSARLGPRGDRAPQLCKSTFAMASVACPEVRTDADRR